MSNFRGVWCTFFFFFFWKFLLANSEDPYQTPRSVATDMGLHCLPMSRKWDARLIWVNMVPGRFGPVVSALSRFGPGSFRSWVVSVRVVSAWVVSVLGRFGQIWWVVSA